MQNMHNMQVCILFIYPIDNPTYLSTLCIIQMSSLSNLYVMFLILFWSPVWMWCWGNRRATNARVKLLVCLGLRLLQAIINPSNVHDLKAVVGILILPMDPCIFFPQGYTLHKRLQKTKHCAQTNTRECMGMHGTAHHICHVERHLKKSPKNALETPNPAHHQCVWLQNQTGFAAREP